MTAGLFCVLRSSTPRAKEVDYAHVARVWPRAWILLPGRRDACAYRFWKGPAAVGYSPLWPEALGWASCRRRNARSRPFECQSPALATQGEDRLRRFFPSHDDRWAGFLPKLSAREGVMKVGGLARRRDPRCGLEAGLCLYGHETSTEDDRGPVRGDLDCGVGCRKGRRRKRRGRLPRASAFPGTSWRNGTQGAAGPSALKAGWPARPARGRAPRGPLARSENPLGTITSGGFGPPLSNGPRSHGLVAFGPRRPSATAG